MGQRQRAQPEQEQTQLPATLQVWGAVATRDSSGNDAETSGELSDIEILEDLRFKRKAD